MPRHYALQGTDVIIHQSVSWTNAGRADFSCCWLRSHIYVARKINHYRLVWWIFISRSSLYPSTWPLTTGLNRCLVTNFIPRIWKSLLAHPWCCHAHLRVITEGISLRQCMLHNGNNFIQQCFSPADLLGEVSQLRGSGAPLTHHSTVAHLS